MKQIVDPFSEVLSALDLIVHQVGSLSLPGSTSLRFPENGPIKCLVLVSGHCCLIVDGAPSAVMLEAGDCAVLPRGATHSLTRGPGPKSVDKRAILVLASGGVFSDGPWKSLDTVEPYLRQILGFIGIDDVQTVRAEGMNVPPLAMHASPNGEKAIEALVI